MVRKPLSGYKPLFAHSGKNQQTRARNHFHGEGVHWRVHLHDQAVGVEHQGLGA